MFIPLQNHCQPVAIVLCNLLYTLYFKVENLTCLTNLPQFYDNIIWPRKVTDSRVSIMIPFLLENTVYTVVNGIDIELGCGTFCVGWLESLEVLFHASPAGNISWEKCRAVVSLNIEYHIFLALIIIPWPNSFQFCLQPMAVTVTLPFYLLIIWLSSFLLVGGGKTIQLFLIF